MVCTSGMKDLVWGLSMAIPTSWFDTLCIWFKRVIVYQLNEGQVGGMPQTSHLST